MKKNLDYYMKLPYTIELLPIADSQGGGFTARLPEIGRLAIIGDGETPEEALKEIEIAMKLWIETAKKHGKPIPKPKSQIINEPKKRFNVIFPESLLNEVDEYRGKHGMKRSELLAIAAEQFISSEH